MTGVQTCALPICRLYGREVLPLAARVESIGDADNEALVAKLKTIGVLNPQPEVHIRGDEKSRYESIGRVVFACQRAGILKISFVTEPPAKG